MGLVHLKPQQIITAANMTEVLIGVSGGHMEAHINDGQNLHIPIGNLGREDMNLWDLKASFMGHIKALIVIDSVLASILVGERTMDHI